MICSTSAKCLTAVALLTFSTGLGKTQVGVSTGPANSALSCNFTAAGTSELRPEGYTELLGDIVITCTGGSVLSSGTAIPTVDITVSVLPIVPITSRLFNATTGLSEALLLIDDPGSFQYTGATGNYGPKAPQLLCTSKNGCPAFAQLDLSGVYPVASSTATAGPNASNVYQGYLGVFGSNSVTFFDVPVLPPALQGVSRIFRITNLRIPAVGLNYAQEITTFLSVSSVSVMPVSAASVPIIGVVGAAMSASVDPGPPGGQNPFSQCIPPQGPALTAQVQFTEGFATGFKTRVVPGGASNGVPGSSANVPYAAEAQNFAAPINQNIPGGLYSGFAANTESALILPAATANAGGVTYTAGLTDFGTRLKAVFSNIPAGISLYVSTTNVSVYPVPGGTSVAPYAVLVGTNRGSEANNDGATFAPLSGATVQGSDGLAAFPLAPDASGTAVAIWEVVNANPAAIDSFSFSIYVNYSGLPPTTGQAGAAVNNVALSFAPEPGGRTFTLPGGAGPVLNPVPRFAILTPQQGSWVSIGACTSGIRSTPSPAPFVFTIGGATPPSQTLGVTTTPSGLSVTATALVTAPTLGTWLVASLTGSTLTVGVAPGRLAASATPYTGTVRLSAPGLGDLLIPVGLTVNPPAILSIAKTHVGNFTQGQVGATYTVTVSNVAAAGSATTGEVTATEQIPDGLTLVSMAGAGWICQVLPTCVRFDALPGGSSYPAIAVTVNVGANANSPQVNAVNVSGGASASASATDSTNILPPASASIIVTHAGHFTQGQTGAVYNVTVHNPVTAPPTSGTVTVTEQIPSGLTLMSMAGMGWTCPGGGTACMRSDVLTAGASYPPITVTVKVASNAPVNVTNQVMVSGGGFTATSASDATLVDTTVVQYLISTYAGGLPALTAATGTDYTLGPVNAVATDPFGNAYFSSGASVFKIDRNGILVRIAGGSLSGFSGDGGPALNALLNSPTGLAVDSVGSLYIADTSNGRIRKVTGGIVTTVAGMGGIGYAGDNGPATSAQLNLPRGVAVDSGGNVYIADTQNSLIRKVTNGIIATVAGGSAGALGDYGPATEAMLNLPQGIAVHTAGNLYIADTNNNRVRKVTGLTITTVAGGGHSGDGAPATSAQLSSPSGVAVDSAGTLFIADTNLFRIRAVSAAGIITTVAGNGIAGYSGDNGPATSARLFGPTGVAVDPSGNLYFADIYDRCLRKVTPGGSITTVAGNGLPSFGGDGGPAPLARFNGIGSVALDFAGSLYLTDGSDCRVSKISPAGIIATIAGNGSCYDSGDGGPAISATVFPSALAIDSAGNVYIASSARVRRIATDGAITTVAGNGTPGYSGDNSSATSAQLSDAIGGLAVDSAKNLYISDSQNFRIRKVTAAGIIITVAGTGIEGYSGDGGPGTSAQFFFPNGIALDTTGNLYIADYYGSRIRMLTPGGIISTVAGTGIEGDTGDGAPATSAQVNLPGSVTVDSSGNLYIGTSSYTIRKVSVAGFISTIAGNGTTGYSGDGALAVNAQFSYPGGMIVDSVGNIYVADGTLSASCSPSGWAPCLRLLRPTPAISPSGRPAPLIPSR